MTRTKSIRALLVTHYYPEHRGGIEVVARELAERLVHRGIDIVWAASEQGSAPVDETVTRLPMRAWNFTERFFGFSYPFWGPLSLVRLWRAVRRAQIIHIHDSIYMGNLFAYLFARLLRKPVVVTQHVGMVPFSQPVLRGLLLLANRTLGRHLLGGCDRCIFISTKVQKYFTEFVPFKTAPLYISNGIVSEIFQPISHRERRCLLGELGLPTDKPVLLFVGRFLERKGLKIMKSLAERFPECHWVFVGWGPIDPSTWKLPNVSCRGSMDRAGLIPYFQAADLLMLPSVGEGFPAVVQQAMACGTPALISADTAVGMPEIASLVFVSDLAVDNIAAKTREILDSIDELEGRRSAVADFAHGHWNWEMCADEYQKILAQLTS
jgi:glycosyltransferase involved in cell wall biosynthesis